MQTLHKAPFDGGVPAFQVLFVQQVNTAKVACVESNGLHSKFWVFRSKWPLEFAKTRNFKEKAASKKEDQKLEHTSNQYFFDKTFQRKKRASERRFDQKHEKLSNQYFCNKILKRYM